jgi:quinoprotein glucose dehydrogenase
MQHVSLFRTSALAVLLIVLVLAGIHLRGQQAPVAPSKALTGLSGPPAGRDWPAYLGDNASTQYSTLDQINKNNVAQLKVAWTYDTGDEGEFQSNALIVDGVLYTASPSRKIIALNAATGEEMWTFDPASERPGNLGRRQRGVVYWASGDDRRIFTGAGPYLYALNAATGKLIPSFGDNGSIHLGEGVDTYGRNNPPSVVINTPGVIYKDMYIAGGLTSGPGTIRAYDVRTGERKWIFYTIPRPGEYGYHSWPADAYKTTGGASNWSGLALDEDRGIVYAPTETAEPDFWGGDRHGANLFANTLLALDANTGKRLWHYQLVHHDLLDKDLPTPPVLLTVKRNGQTIDAVAQGTKNGVLFVFDRVTGEPLWPIHEVPVPQTDLPGEQTWPTQPIPTKPRPLTRQTYTAGDVSNISPEAFEMTSLRFKQVGSHGPFPAPSLQETIIFPGFDGGMEWGGAAADPDGIYYANVNEIPWIYQMVATRNPDGTPVSMGERAYKIHCAYCHGLDREGDEPAGFSSLLDLAERSTHAEVTQVVEQGAGRMPAFGHLREGQRRALVDFLLGQEKPASAYVEQGRRDGRAERREDPPYIFAGFRRWFDDEGYPAIKPPWGTLNAVDLNTGEIKWKVPLGEYPELTARGIPPTGTENYGGPVVTASGLIFIGATADETFRAFDKDTGRILWQAKLPFSGNATPSIYAVDGKQYVAISAGGGKSGRPAGGSIVAFALPD